ncbi:MAG: ABC-2 transporter permease, partial [Chromatocurvus sp.]
RAFVWTPLIIAVLLGAAMLVSVLLIDRISVFGDTLVQVIEKQASGGRTTILIRSGSRDDGAAGDAGEVIGEVDLPSRPAPPDIPESAWNFDLDWTFSPPPAEDAGGTGTRVDDGRIASLNPLLNMLHSVLLLVLMITVPNYLLRTLYDDRKDRSILFWRSLPVSEWESVLSKFAMALIVAPAILIAVSIVLQVVTTLIAMLMVWRLDMAPLAVLGDNLAPGRLLVGQVGGWLLSALWLAPVVAWFLLASAAARRSPFLFAVTPVVAAILLEKLFLKTGLVLRAVGNHMPGLAGEADGVGFYVFGPDWTAVNWWSLASGIVFAAAATTLAVYLRRHRWEI